MNFTHCHQSSLEREREMYTKKLRCVELGCFAASGQKTKRRPTAATKAKGSYLRDKFHRLKARRGYKRAVVTVAHKILAAIYHILSHRVCYNELGDLCLDKLNKHSLTRNLVHRLERLGYAVTLEQKGRMNPVPLAHTGR